MFQIGGDGRRYELNYKNAEENRSAYSVKDG